MPCCIIHIKIIKDVIQQISENCKKLVDFMSKLVEKDIKSQGKIYFLLKQLTLNTTLFILLFVTSIPTVVSY